MSELKGKKILLIDDDRLFTEPLLWRLEREGFNVQFANDNDTALDLIRDKKYDIIIQDIMRPPGKCLEDYDTGYGRSSGIIFYEKYIRQFCPEVPVVFLSVAADSKIPREIQASRLCTSICKPALPSEVLIVIRSILNQSKENLYYRDEVPSNVASIISVDVRTVTQELMKYLAKHPEYVYSLNPRKFEELVAQIFSDLNYDVRLTPETCDGGKDIYAIRKDSLADNLFLIECKKYSMDQKVGVEHVRSLYGIKQAEKATAAILVTTSFFTEPAQKFQSKIRYELSLRDYDDLKKWLQRYK